MRSTPKYIAQAAVLALGLFAAGCADLTRVSDPTIVQPGANNDSTGAVGRRSGAIITFSTSFAYQVIGSGLISDELGAPNAGFSGDRRVNTAVQGDGYPYDLLSNARINLLRAIASLKKYDPNPTWHIGELYAYLGDLEVFFAENMCSGVPLGTVVNDVPTYGLTASRDSLLKQAMIDFDSATAESGGSDSVANLAAIGKARALLNSGDFAAAAVLAAQVPASFSYLVQFAGLGSGVNDPNPINTYAYSYSQIFASDNEGINGLNFVSAGDPRTVTTTSNGLAVPVAYALPTSPIILASGIEGQLIAAEADLRSGATAQWALILNELRQTAITPPMAPLPADSTTGASPSAQVLVMFRERAFWLFLTGHRHGDLRRLVREYGMAVESVFPTGLYEGGPQTYGTAVVYQPFSEGLNPNYHGCFNQDP